MRHTAPVHRPGDPPDGKQLGHDRIHSATNGPRRSPDATSDATPGRPAHSASGSGTRGSPRLCQLAATDPGQVDLDQTWRNSHGPRRHPRWHATCPALPPSDCPGQCPRRAVRINSGAAHRIPSRTPLAVIRPREPLANRQQYQPRSLRARGQPPRGGPAKIVAGERREQTGGSWGLSAGRTICRFAFTGILHFFNR